MVTEVSNERLQRLRPTGSQLEDDENTAPLFRQILLAWIGKTVTAK